MLADKENQISWSGEILVDDDGHLNIYIDNQGSDIIEIETGQGNGKNEQFALRFTTAKIEADYLESTNGVC